MKFAEHDVCRDLGRLDHLIIVVGSVATGSGLVHPDSGSHSDKDPVEFDKVVDPDLVAEDFDGGDVDGPFVPVW